MSKKPIKRNDKTILNLFSNSESKKSEAAKASVNEHVNNRGKRCLIQRLDNTLEMT